MLGYLALALLPVAAVAYIVWSHRKRTAERAAASSKRFADMFGTAARSQPTGAAASAAKAAPTPLCTKRERVLEGQHASLFDTVRAACPEYLLFPHLTLAALVDLPLAVQGRDREQRLRALAQHAVHLVVCDAHARVIAAVDMEQGQSAATRIKADYLASAGLKYLRLNAEVLHDTAEVRRLLLPPEALESAA